MRFRRLSILLACLVGIPTPPSLADPPTPATKTKPRYETRTDHDPNGIGKFYMGREIAQVMGHLAAEWLERPEREREEAPNKLLDALKIRPGEVIADIGAGSGYFTFRLAERTGPKGEILAVDIQPEMLALIRQRMKERKLTNIDLILGSETDPKLPETSVDTILLVDVYHEFSFPWEMTSAMVKALKPGGRLVFVEYRLEDPEVPIKLVHKMTEKQVRKEMSVHPLTWEKTIWHPAPPTRHYLQEKRQLTSFAGRARECVPTIAPVISFPAEDSDR